MGTRPDVARRPTTPDPGATGLKSASSTIVLGGASNMSDAVGDVPRGTTDSACTGDSEDPMASVMTSAVGMAFSSRSLTSDDRMLPPEPSISTDDVSYAPVGLQLLDQ